MEMRRYRLSTLMWAVAVVSVVFAGARSVARSFHPPLKGPFVATFCVLTPVEARRRIAAYHWQAEIEPDPTGVWFFRYLACQLEHDLAICEADAQPMRSQEFPLVSRPAASVRFFHKPSSSAETK